GTAANGRSALPRPTSSAYVPSARDSRSRARSSRACERRPGSSTKLASIESNDTPASSTPARRKTSQSYFTSWPAFGTRASASSSRNGASASLVSGGRFRGTAPPASSPSDATCAKGRYHDRPGATASDRPTSSARIGSSADALVASASSDARRDSATSAGSCAGSVTITGSALASLIVAGKADGGP